ncbi:hypothetical protein [Streptomyces odonnellii]|uniref:hypothetical protein n=1 Tax=Streptomyces odonnellii TaxID=1417980 RepID=UPI0012FEF157|nr:hypothetical protein [Streptomyces odonnellii]
MTDATRTRRAAGHTGDGADRASETRAGGGLRMHTLHADLPIPYLTASDITANARAAGSKLTPPKPPLPSMPSMPPLPPPKRLAFYGGLGALAVLGALDWPVAVAIGAATVVARSGRRGEGEESDGGGRAAKGGRAESATRRPRKTAATPPAEEESKPTARGGGTRGGTRGGARGGTRGAAKKATAKA